MAKMDKLKKKMKQRGVTYSELSRKMDINRSTLYRKIAGNGEGFPSGKQRTSGARSG